MSETREGSAVFHGYKVTPAVNGGWIVETPTGYSPSEVKVVLKGAFSNSRDLLDWLRERHEVHDADGEPTSLSDDGEGIHG